MFDREINLSASHVARVDDNRSNTSLFDQKKIHIQQRWTSEEISTRTKKSSNKRWEGNEVTNKLPSFILSSVQSQVGRCCSTEAGAFTL